jgi:hypothetical protein
MDYMKLYLLCDVGLLADVFENFRQNCREQYQLDPSFYLSAPQLAWDAMLKRTAHRFELLNDAEMYRMIQPAIRGGICHAAGRYAKANNKYMGSLYNPNEPSRFITYVS